MEGISVYFIACNSFRQGSYVTTLANNISGYVYNSIDGVNSYFYLKTKNEDLVKENLRLRSMVESSFVEIVNSVHQKKDTVYKQMYSFIMQELYTRL